MEECNETAQRASKAIRFGLTEVQPGQQLTNAQRIVYEFNDILAVMELLHGYDYIPPPIQPLSIKLKKEKLHNYIDYAKDCGTIQ